MTSPTGLFTKRRSLFGIPVGRRRPNWGAIAKAGMVGLGALSVFASRLQGAEPGSGEETGSGTGQGGSGSRRLPPQLAELLKTALVELEDPIRELTGVPRSRRRSRPQGRDSARTARNGSGKPQSRDGRSQPRNGSKSAKRSGARTAKASKSK